MSTASNVRQVVPVPFFLFFLFVLATATPQYDFDVGDEQHHGAPYTEMESSAVGSSIFVAVYNAVYYHFDTVYAIALEIDEMAFRTTRWLSSLVFPLVSVLLHGGGEITPGNAQGIVNFNITGWYNGSVTPSSLPWNTYNYCNAPHVNKEHYTKPDVSNANLVYMNVMIRHHKRTPDNLYPSEALLNPASGWNCADIHYQNFGGGTANVFHNTIIPSWHPFLIQMWNGTCDEGTLTAEGLQDAVKHGQDFWSVYHDTVPFLSTVNENDIYVRTSTEDRTYQVAGGLLFGMDPSTATKTWPVFVQPSPIDSLPPDYSCPTADNIRDVYESISPWTDHLDQNAALQARLGNMLGTRGMSAWETWYDHYFDTFTSRTCNGHPLPCNETTGDCVTESDANMVHAIGDWEYNYIWWAADNATTYNQLTFGPMFQELAMNFKEFQSGTASHKLKFYVGHDGSMIRLASGLQLPAKNGQTLRWPALGSEIVMEVWETGSTTHPFSNSSQTEPTPTSSTKSTFVRVMHEGTSVQGLDWVPLQDFIDLLDSNVPENLFNVCMGTN